MILYDYHISDEKCISEEQADRLETYLQSVWNKRLDNQFWREMDEENLARTRQQILTVDRKLRICTKKYVGIINCGDLNISIKPRILKGISSEENWGFNILFWLSYCNKLNFPIQESLLKDISSEDLLEIFIKIFARYTNNTISNQPYSSYSSLEEESTFLRGELLFNKYIQSLSIGHWHNFQIRHSPFIFDNLINQIIKFVTRKLLTVSKSSSQDLESILFLLDEVSDISCSALDCEKVRINPIYSDYESIISMCHMFLDNLMIDIEHGNSTNYSFLLPMDYIFEGFVLGFIETHFSSLRPQGQLCSFLANRDNRSIFKVKKDIYLRELNVIIDTKYKIRHDDNDGKGGVLQSDIYQMISYGVHSDCINIILLYPKIEGKINDKASFLVYNNYNKEKDINIIANSLDITVDPSYSLRDNAIQLKERFNNLLLDTV